VGPRRRGHRYYGVLAPNSPLRPAVTALAPEAAASAPASHRAVKTAAEDPPETIRRSPARYLWVMRLAHIYETFSLTCPRCGAEMCIIAFITEVVDVQAILEHIGEPATPPRTAPPGRGNRRSGTGTLRSMPSLPRQVPLAIPTPSPHRSTNTTSGCPGNAAPPG